MGDLRVFNGLVARDHPGCGFGIYSTANTLIAETARALTQNPDFKTQRIPGRCRHMLGSSTKIEKNTEGEAAPEAAPYVGLSTNT
ncbi:hypothetical protein Trisim1_003134 [Trichoderma cf. simile WF8]